MSSDYNPWSAQPEQAPQQPGYPASQPSAYPASQSSAYPAGQPDAYGQPQADPYGQPQADPYGGQQAYAPQAAPQAAPATPAAPPGTLAPGKFGALFDFQLRQAATPAVAMIFNILCLVFAVLCWIGLAIWLFAMGNSLSSVVGSNDFTLYGVVQLLLGWIPAAIFIIAMRMLTEFFVAQYQKFSA